MRAGRNDCKRRAHFDELHHVANARSRHRLCRIGAGGITWITWSTSNVCAPSPLREQIRRGAQRPRRLLPKGQHLLLVGRIAVRLNETAGAAGQPLSIPPRHVSDLRGDELRDVSDPTFLTLSARTRTGRVYCPSRRLRTMVEASAWVGSISTKASPDPPKSQRTKCRSCSGVKPMMRYSQR